MKATEFRIKDELRHPRFSWPLSPVFQDVAADFDASSAVLTDEAGQEMPFQLVTHGDGKKQICFMMAIPCGTDALLRLKPLKSPRKAAPAENELAGKHAAIHLTESGFEIRAQGGAVGRARIEGGSPVAAYSSSMTTDGPVFTEAELNATFENGAAYRLILRAWRELPFFELEEDIRGESHATLMIDWAHFAPNYRFCRDRERTAVDAYLSEEGYLPWRIKPYTSAVNFWEGHQMSFFGKDEPCNIGIFARKTDEWQTKEYQLWEAAEDNAVRLALREERLIFEYPLSGLRRVTALAVYPYMDERVWEHSAIGQMRLWYEAIPFMKVRGWTLRWEEDQGQYPLFFDPAKIPDCGYHIWHYGTRHKPATADEMSQIIYSLSHMMNHVFVLHPVPIREMFHWIHAFDHSAPEMDAPLFDDIRACMAFAAYTTMDESTMPVKNILGGHPNFLADARAAAALCAALFPNHPDAPLWISQFETAMRRNMKYHIRPAVAAWGAKGGRWTENLGCYNFASLDPMVKVQMLCEKQNGLYPVLQPPMVDWATYLLNALSAPVNDVRHYPPQGAHSGTTDPITPSFYLHRLGGLMENYSPLIGEYLRYAAKPALQNIGKGPEVVDLFKTLGSHSDGGTRPYLRSAKFTGYGFILRAGQHTENEVSVHLQQIDEGPNYRWGRSGEGGCGALYYYAQNRRFSYNRPEDIGDANMGDAEVGCTFGVLDGHEYKSVGRADLTEPMYDFGFAQYARVKAGPRAKALYRSRSVILAGNDYMVVNDSVTDSLVRGRFTWFSKDKADFPNIVQLRPGAAFIEAPEPPMDASGKFNNTAIRPYGRHYDGDGDFLTLVTHRQINCDYNMYVHRTDDGVRVEHSAKTDYVFARNSMVDFHSGDLHFKGYEGIIIKEGDHFGKLAVFRGLCASVCGVSLTLNHMDAAAGITIAPGRIAGQLVCQRPTVITLEGEGLSDGVFLLGDKLMQPKDGMMTLTLEAGTYEMEWTKGCLTPRAFEITASRRLQAGTELVFTADSISKSYEAQTSLDGGASWQPLAVIDEPRLMVTVPCGAEKMHVRLRGVNGDRAGGWSHDYPVYASTDLPAPPKGLHAYVADGEARIHWGEVLGACGYRLYRQDTLIYDGANRQYTETCPDGSMPVYTVTAFDGVGESTPCAPVQALADWDPEPQRGFVRYTKSHEYGYQGYDVLKNQQIKPLADYPE